MIRAVPSHTTLRHAKAWADRAGIEAVSDITALDCLGVPIFVSERRVAGSTSYAFGKGRLPIEAEIGAYMEAIEGYFSAPGVAPIETRYGRPAELSGVQGGAEPLLEFAPKFDCPADPDRPLLLARAEDVESGATGWVPAELAFHPAPPGLGVSLYGATGNGLASGNTVPEASLHALYELIERDIWSIEFVRNRGARVDDAPLPPPIQAVAAAAARNGLQLLIRHVPNDYGIPFFAAFLYQPDRLEARSFNGGWGCHPRRDVALTRAVAEAAQGRLAFRLGLRDPKKSDDSRPEADRIRTEIDTLSSTVSHIRLGDVPEWPDAPTLEAQWLDAIRGLRRVVDRPIFRLIYTPADGPLHVVRLIVPRLEHFTPSTRRMGPRLRAELEALARSSAVSGS